MPRRPSHALRVSVAGLKAGVVCLIAATATGVPGSTGAAGLIDHDDATPAGAQQARVERLMSAHRCSTTGFGPDVVPGSALVLRGDRVRRVSFDTGWAVYTGQAPGTLIAVCRAEL